MSIESNNFFNPQMVQKQYDDFFRTSLRVTETLGALCWIDPFAATKKKCIPTDIDSLSPNEREWIIEKIVHYSTVEFTFDSRDWASFNDKKMNNLIVDDRWKLLQLIFLCSNDAKLPPKQKLIQATEFVHISDSRKTTARRFEKYI